jgi:hypothetical protein
MRALGRRQLPIRLMLTLRGASHGESDDVESLLVTLGPIVGGLIRPYVDRRWFGTRAFAGEQADFVR